MSDQPAFPDLKGWQACLALAESRLANPDFTLEVRHAFDFADEDGRPPQRWELAAQVQGVSIKVLRAGRDLVKLHMRLRGTLKIGTREHRFENAEWATITSFEVTRHASACHVVANLGDPRRKEDVTVSGLDPVYLEYAVSRWADAPGTDKIIQLFSYDIAAGQGTGVQFTHFQVTTSFAEVSSVHSSFLLLMTDAPEPPSASPPVIDPHILPQGETAIVWVTRQTLERSSGMAVADEAEHQLSLRPRFLGIDLPGVTAELSQWAGTIIDHVDLPVPLEFTSMQMDKDGLKLSATPLSLDELDQLSAGDLTVSRQSLVQQKAYALFADCVLFHLDDKYRKLLGKDKPKLFAEVAVLAQDHVDWLRSFGRLQVALTAKNSPGLGDQAPYSRLDKKTIEHKLRYLCETEKCKQLIDKLYPLAFCLVRPRLSLYIDERETWLPLYKEHLASDSYVDGLLLIPGEAVARIHEDAAKLSLLDRESAAVSNFVKNTTASFLKALGERNWKAVVAARPNEFSEALGRALDGPSEPLAPNADDWPARVGGAKEVVGKWAPALAAEAAQPRTLTLQELAADFADSMHWVGETLVTRLVLAAEIAVIAILVAPTQALAATGSIRNLSPYVNQAVDGLITTAKGAHALGVTQLIAFGNFFLKGVRWVEQTIMQGAQEAATFFSTSAGVFFRAAGAVLSLASLGLALADFAKDLADGAVAAVILDVVNGFVAAFSFFFFVAAPAGPYGAVLMVIGLLISLALFVVRLFAKSQEEKDAEALVEAVEAMPVR